MAKPRILVVEDEALVAQNVRETLARLGYEVAGVAATGEQALRLAREKKPDLVLMDIRLSGNVTGVDTAERLNADAAVPVVYLTAFSAEVTLERIVSTRPYGFVQKPYSETVLRATIETALQRSALETSLRDSQEHLRDLTGTLELKVIERTRELKHSLEQLAKLSSSLAHDMRSLLGVISSFSHLLVKDEAAGLTEDGRRKLATIESNVARVVELVDELIARANSPGPKRD